MIDLQKRKKPPRFPRAASLRTISSSRLAAPPNARLETLGRIPAWNRACDCPQGVFAAILLAMLTAEQTIAIGRKYGAHRYRFVVENDQHDLVKVNSRLETVKIFFACSVSW